jgi:ketosteroid isomerase-like protein
MREQEALALMKEFRQAFGTADKNRLKAVTSDDFEWHQHAAHNPEDRRTGRVLVGIDALLDEIVWRRKNWQNVHYDGLNERSAGDLLVQTFTISGTDENGKGFQADAVDLYPIRDGQISRKDTFWKYLK